MWIAIVGLALAPTGAGQGPADGPERLVVQFDELPIGLGRGGSFHGAPVLFVDDTLGFAVVEAAHGKAFRREAAANAHVRHVEVDPIREALAFTPNDPQYSTKQYAPQLVGAPAAWASSLGSTRTICILDTGLRYTHEDIKANYAGGIDLVNNDANPWDDNGHGTRVAGAAAATVNNGLGVAGISNARLLSVKVLDNAGYTYGSAIASGIRWCADNGANIVSMSFGGAGNDTATYQSVMYAWHKGVLVVAGAGNGGCDDCVIYPAALDAVVAVGCVDQTKAICSFTSRGSQVDLAAPGVNIQTVAHTGDADYALGGGTSMSTPIVAGAAALVWGANPGWTNAQVRDALEKNAVDVGAAGPDTASGAGLVRPDLAMGIAAAPTPTTSAPFSASFDVSPNVNEWWIEVNVKSSGVVSKVETRVNGGVWQSLPKTNWGAWAKSINAPKGSKVEFRATDSQAQTVLSPAYTWMTTTTTGTTSPSASSSPSPTPTSSPSPTPTASPSPTTSSSTTANTFAAAFTPKAQTNVWWIETAVSSSSSITKVDARVNGGSWVALPKTDWGTWAKSIHAPTGSKVEFRATSSTGATAQSAAYTWG
jgi:hypothetical protein